MKNRFDKQRMSLVRETLYRLPFLILAVIVITFVIGISSVDDTTYEKQMESLETALHRSISQCYAVEGTYPPSLDYLKEHYGIFYDSELFYVDYTSIGSNIMPDITIIPLQTSD